MSSRRWTYGNVYILHFEQKVGHVQHYTGISRDVEARIEQHRATRWEPLPEPIVDGRHVKRGATVGHGTPLLGYLNYKGIGFQLARVFQHVTRDFERALKNTKNISRYCPICNPDAPEYHPKESKE